MLIGLKKKLPVSVSDSDLLNALKWTDEAPKKLSKAAKKGEVFRFVIAYRAWLEPAAARFRKYLGCSVLSLAGRRNAGTLAALVTEYTTQDSRPRMGLGRAILGWLQGAAARSLSASELLTVLELLLNPPIDLEAEGWFRLWRLALTTTVETESAKSQVGTTASTEAALQRALLFGPLTGSAKLHRAALNQAETDLLELTDTDGTPHVVALRDFSNQFSAIVRCAWWGRGFQQMTFTGDALVRFDELTTKATQLCRDDGSFVFDTLAQGVGRSILPLAIRCGELSKKSGPARFVRSLETSEWKASKKEQPVSGSQSDWAGVAILRSDASPTSDYSIVALGEDDLQLEVGCFARPVLLGPWVTEAIVDGKTTKPRGGWSCSCWFTDEDGDYMELEQSRGSLRFERQLYLSRKQHFLLLTDTVRTGKPKQLSHRTSMQLAPQIMSRADYISREWRLHTGQLPIRVFPVSLEFDRIQSTTGQCSVDGDVLTLEQTGVTSATAAMVLDWHPDRSELDAEWTQLTVTESRQFVSRSDATAFRVRVGGHQLLCYRNTSNSTALRTVLGQHLKHESTIGTLDSSGVFKPLVLVEHAG